MSKINFHDLVSSEFVAHQPCNLCFHFIARCITSSEQEVSLSELEKWDVRVFKDSTCTVNTNTGSLNKRGELYLSGVHIFSIFILCYHPSKESCQMSN